MTRVATARRAVPLAGRCAACGSTHLPAKPLCPECWGEVISDVPVVSVGKLETYVVVHRGPAGFDVPYALGWAGFEDEGVRVLAPIRTDDLETLACGLPVRLEVEERRESTPLTVLRISR